MANCLFISKDVQKELFAAGLKEDTNYPLFDMKGVSGILVSDDVMSDFIKKTGIRIEKTVTDYEEIYKLLGYMLPVLKKEIKEDFIDGKGKASVVDQDYPDSTPVVAEEGVPDNFTKCNNGTLKNKLKVAITALTEVAAMIE